MLVNYSQNLRNQQFFVEKTHQLLAGSVAKVPRFSHVHVIQLCYIGLLIIIDVTSRRWLTLTSLLGELDRMTVARQNSNQANEKVRKSGRQFTGKLGNSANRI